MSQDPAPATEANGILPLDAQLRNLDGASLGAVQSLLGSAPAPTRSQLLTRATSAGSHTYRRNDADEMLVPIAASWEEEEAALSHTLSCVPCDQVLCPLYKAQPEHGYRVLQPVTSGYSESPPVNSLDPNISVPTRHSICSHYSRVQLSWLQPLSVRPPQASCEPDTVRVDTDPSLHSIRVATRSESPLVASRLRTDNRQRSLARHADSRTHRSHDDCLSQCAD